jgi:translocation protein SEC62
MRQGVYYLSLVAMGLLCALLVLGVFRWILWILLLLVIGRGGWLYPNLFADVGFFDSFRPVWSWDPLKGSGSSAGAGGVKTD